MKLSLHQNIHNYGRDYARKSWLIPTEHDHAPTSDPWPRLARPRYWTIKYRIHIQEKSKDNAKWSIARTCTTFLIPSKTWTCRLSVTCSQVIWCGYNTCLCLHINRTLRHLKLLIAFFPIWMSHGILNRLRSCAKSFSVLTLETDGKKTFFSI